MSNIRRMNKKLKNNNDETPGNIIVNDIEFLRRKAASLPLSPGVYIMENKLGEVIYVGKSRALRNRVSSYFHGRHDIKTTKMASNVNNFRFIVCNTEMDALVLENDLIKKYTPKYNILLKDSKSYPYIKVTGGAYPTLTLSRTKAGEGKYFGPYSSSGTVWNVITTLQKTLGIPSCKHSFPRDIGKIRPCVYRQIGRCCGVCAGDVDEKEYSEIIATAMQILKGDIRTAVSSLEERMYCAAEEERFEEAARCRDSITALQKLAEKRKVTSLPPGSEFDVIAISEAEGQQCAAVFYIRDGIISDSEQFIFGDDEITGFVTKNEMDSRTVGVATEDEDGGDYAEESDFPLTSFIINLYMGREYIPSEILLSFDIPEKEKSLAEEYLSRRAERKVVISTPQRGEKKQICTMVQNDARRHAESRKKRADSDERVLVSLASMLSLEVVPERIECYDISNYGDEHITAGMTVAENGRLKKRDYRYFRIKSTGGQDDYGSMRETLERRFNEAKGEDESFTKLPDLILLDGGDTHVAVVRKLLFSMGYDIPVYGMVKDSHHKTRTLTADGEEISIARDMAVFQFVYKLQEEVHRFTVSRTEAAKRKTLKTSSLEKIKGIGPAKAKKMLLAMGTMEKIKTATISELSAVEGISESDAEKVFDYFRKEE